MAWRRISSFVRVVDWACGFIPRHPTLLSPAQLQTSI